MLLWPFCPAAPHADLSFFSLTRSVTAVLYFVSATVMATDTATPTPTPIPRLEFGLGLGLAMTFSLTTLLPSPC